LHLRALRDLDDDPEVLLDPFAEIDVVPCVHRALRVMRLASPGPPWIPGAPGRLAEIHSRRGLSSASLISVSLTSRSAIPTSCGGRMSASRSSTSSATTPM